VQSSPLPVTSSLRPEYFPQHLILEHPQPLFLPYCETPTFTPYQTTGRITILCTLTEYI
jgi:hypothetical protein